MQDAGARLVGRRDFSSFAADPRGGVRSVRSATWCEQGPALRFEITADAFLRGMVRAIVGTLLWVGRGKIDVATFGKIVDANDRAMAGPSAPANGLCLVAVEYRQDAANAASEEGWQGIPPLREEDE
jgi:tRNA pseudouridine38-40 synthase